MEILNQARTSGKDSFYNYNCHLRTELPKLTDDKETIIPAVLDPRLTWSKELPEKCYKSR